MIANIFVSALRIYSLALIVYTFLKVLQPNQQITRFLAQICEPVLVPARRFLYRQFPALYKIPFDLTAVIIIFAINIVEWILFLIF